MKQLKPQDAQFLFMEDANLASHITGISIYDQSTAPGGIVRFKDILNLAEERLHDSPIYSQKLMRLPLDMDFPYWVEDKFFEIENHVSHRRLPQPADWRQFCIQVARLHSKPMDMTRPPWEFHVIEGLNNIDDIPEGAFAIVMKMHHAAFDGTSALRFMSSIADLGPTGPALFPPAPNKIKTQTSTSPAKLVRRAAASNASSPVKFARSALKYAPALARESAMRAMGQIEKSTPAVKTRFNGEISPNRAFDSVTFDLNEFKRIAKTFGEAKVNDIVLAVVAGGLREYLGSKNELPDIPLKISAPVNLRAKDAKASDSDGNNISTIVLPIFTNIKNPVDRLNAIVSASQAAKASKSGVISRLAMEAIQHVPAPAISVLGPLLVRAEVGGDLAANAVVSNVAGPPIPLYVCGAEMIRSMAMAPIGSGLGLFIATPSYNGQISFSITTTRQIMPDTPYFMDCLRRAVQELSEATDKKLGIDGVPGQPRKTYHRTRAKGTSALKPKQTEQTAEAAVIEAPVPAAPRTKSRRKAAAPSPKKAPARKAAAETAKPATTRSPKSGSKSKTTARKSSGRKAASSTKQAGAPRKRAAKSKAP
ncbi:MAG: wax ester/triacylglycerol synthase family O-acyltransferase [Pseudomonadota bacterium]